MGSGLTGVGSLVLSINSITANIEEIPDLVQLATVTAKVNLRAIVQLAQGRLDLAQAVSLRLIGSDTSSGECLFTRN